MGFSPARIVDFFLDKSYEKDLLFPWLLTESRPESLDFLKEWYPKKYLQMKPLILEISDCPRGVMVKAMD